ncbi:hypothetical protein QM012_003751 [Aureobasidium pullulans]|uniref:Kinase-like protein n=1 Tax=Aureobasidium pullulans TaxID=5580 RepID=A0ABR0T8Z6_AURPU
MSSPKQSSAEKKNKIRETCRRGPENGFPFIVDEVFRQRGPISIPDPVVRKGPRPAGPHRAIKTSAAESESNSVRIGETAERSTSNPVSSTQAPANNPSAVSTDESKPSSSYSSFPETMHGQRQTEDSSMTFKPASEPAASSTTMPGTYAESEDGGVGLPEDTTSRNKHETAYKVATVTGSGGSSSGNHEDVPKDNGGDEGRGQHNITASMTGTRDVAGGGDELGRIFARLAAINRSRRGD